MKEAMIKTKETYYRERKKIRFYFDSYTQLSKPSWMLTVKDDRFESTYRDQRILIKEGRIAFACIVQANTLLFKPGKHNCPAAMIFSEDTFFEEHPNKLGDIASQLFTIKGATCDDEELQMFSDILADEKVTLFNYKVPEKLAYGKKVFFTSFMVHREHLPEGYIDFSYFPALICPEKTEASIILPSRYWAYEFRR